MDSLRRPPSRVFAEANCRRNGSRAAPSALEVPDWQVQEYNEDLYILRESGCTDFEKPFLYLFFGKERALLEDTGSGTS